MCTALSLLGYISGFMFREASWALGATNTRSSSVVTELLIAIVQVVCKEQQLHRSSATALMTLAPWNRSKTLDTGAVSSCSGTQHV